MEEETILREDGLISKAASLSTEDSSAFPDDTLLNSEDEYPSAQIQRPTDKPKERKEEQPPKPPKSHTKRRSDTPHGSYKDPPKKRSRHFQQENAESVKQKIRKSEESISKLQAHSDKGTCPKTLRYNARANISPDEEFKQDITLIRKNAQQKYLGALIKFHYRRVERNKTKPHRIQQLEQRKSNDVNLARNKAHSTVHEPRANVNKHEERIENIQKKMHELKQMMLNIQKDENKAPESYPNVSFMSTYQCKRERVPKRAIHTKKRNERRKRLRRDIDQKILESKKRYIKNLSDSELTRDQINLLARGLKFIPTPAVTSESHIRLQLLNDFEAFARRMRLQYMFHGQNKEPHPFHVNSNWEPPIQPSVALETYLEEVKTRLAEVKILKPRNNLPHRERQAIKELKQNTNINIKKADKGTTTVIMNKEDKIREGQVLLDERENYESLALPMVTETSLRVQTLIKALYHGNYIDEMTEKWLSLTPNPPRIPVFYTLTKIHKPNPVGRPIISGCDSPTERISSFVDYLLQPIAEVQESYLKDTTDFLNFIEETKVAKDTMLVSMDVTSLYTNIPQEEGINIVCDTYESYHLNKPPIPTLYLRDMLKLILKENSFHFNGKNYLQTHGTAMGTKMAVSFANIFMAAVETEIINRSHFKPLIWKRYIDDIFSLWNINEEEIYSFTELANNYHPTIKFTAEISDTEITFLDTCIYKGERFKKESILDVRTHFKPTETFQYTHFTSCHPPGVRKGFIKGEALRLLRTNSSKATFEENITQFKRRLRDRGYPDNLLENTISEIKFSERMSALQNKQKTRKRILPFVTEYRPSVPNLKNILMSKWHLIENQPLLREIYKDPPLLSYRKGRSLKDVLVRAKL